LLEGIAGNMQLRNITCADVRNGAQSDRSSTAQSWLQEAGDLFKRQRVCVLAVELYPKSFAIRGKNLQDIEKMLDQYGNVYSAEFGNSMWRASD
jgi:hypothetical protein